jgi:hypothetical protein
MIKPEIRRVDHEREVAPVQLTGQGRDARRNHFAQDISTALLAQGQRARK